MPFFEGKKIRIINTVPLLIFILFVLTDSVVDVICFSYFWLFVYEWRGLFFVGIGFDLSEFHVLDELLWDFWKYLFDDFVTVIIFEVTERDKLDDVSFIVLVSLISLLLLIHLSNLSQKLFINLLS